MIIKEQIDALLKNTAVHCKTEDEANQVLALADKFGYKWCNSDDTFSSKTHYQNYKEQTCYTNIIHESKSLGAFNYFDANNCTSERQAEKLLAINKLMNVAKYLNKGWKPNWNDINEQKYYFDIYNNILAFSNCTCCNGSLVYFRNADIATQAIDILGEETIKLALSTDY